MSKMKRENKLGTIVSSDEKNLEQREAMQEENYEILRNYIRNLPDKTEEEKEDLIKLIGVVNEIKGFPCWLFFSAEAKGTAQIHNALAIENIVGYEETADIFHHFRWNIFRHVIQQTKVAFNLSDEDLLEYIKKELEYLK